MSSILDIFLGLIPLILALSALLTNIGTSYGLQMASLIVMEALSVLAFVGGKTLITVPRMGIVEFGPKRKRKVRRSRVTLPVSVLVGFLVFVVASLVLRSYPAGRSKLLLPAPVAWVANSIIVFSLLACYLDCSRFCAYEVLFALPVPCDMAIKELAGISLSAIAFTLQASVMLVVGVVLLIRFLRKYPVSYQEASDGKG